MTAYEAQAVALLLENRAGFVHVFGDGSALWSPTAPNLAAYRFPEECPTPIACRRMSYKGAQMAYRKAARDARTRSNRR